MVRGGGADSGGGVGGTVGERLGALEPAAGAPGCCAAQLGSGDP